MKFSSNNDDFASLGDVVALINAEEGALIYMRDGKILKTDKSVRALKRKYEEILDYYQKKSE
ncbi:hypothetical protein [Acetomicrobium sp. UBA5826]|uniref:hypothetical protein n=1 Tax=Acetomicrobium sp. UBA5826 TaxID=1946039 RepID=UPI00257F997B|nr:hypothetical protein [Acetomicrobium sp. UBA5826]